MQRFSPRPVPHVLWALLCLAASAHGQVPAADSPLGQEALQAMQTSEASAAAAVMYVGADATAAGFGTIDRDKSDVVGPDTEFHIGSVTKMFVGLLALQLQEQGVLSLETPVADLPIDFPIRNPWEATHPLRLVHLLEHTAGFDDLHFRNMWATPGLDLQDQLQRMEREMTVRWPPGERFAYSNPGYGVAARVIEQVTQRDIRELIRERIWKPLGMTNTRWVGDPAGASFAVGQLDDAEERRAISLPVAGGVISTATDMGHLVRFLLTRGASAPGVVSAAAILRMERAQEQSWNAFGLALRLWNRELLAASRRVENANAMMEECPVTVRRSHTCRSNRSVMC